MKLRSFLVYALGLSLAITLFSFQKVFASAVLPTGGLSTYTVQLEAVVQETPPSITLSWPFEAGADIDSYRVYRKAATSTAWGSIRTTVGSTTLSYEDTTVSVGTAYEYRVVKRINGVDTAYGYIYSGIKVPFEDDRGTVILLIDQTMATPLASEITRFKEDLAGDGWTVVAHEVGRSDSVSSIKSQILSDYTNYSFVRQVILLGHIPVPYAGNLAPDNHADHIGAWPADIYYGDMTSAWTDTTIDTTTAADSRNHNIPGDGKFDQNASPDGVTLAVGRIDLSQMPTFYTQTEAQLLSQYLTKNHEYRTKGSIDPSLRALVSDNLGASSGEAFAASGWRTFAPLVGSSQLVSSTTGFFNELTSSDYLWAYGGGGGTYTSATNIGNTTNFSSSSPHAVFNMLFGSYFGDWDVENSFLRAPLASAGWGLASVWSGRPWWTFHHMALGETLGYDMLKTANNSSTYFLNTSPGVEVALMGDPTLRLYPIAPPTSGLSSSTDRTARLTWVASSDTGLEGYSVYRATSKYGPYEVLTDSPIVATTYEDTVSTDGTYYYMIRARSLETSPSGSFWNESQGLFIGPISLSAPVVVTSRGGGGGGGGSRSTVTNVVPILAPIVATTTRATSTPRIPPLNNPVPPPNFNRSLMVGTSGPDVKVLQQYLNASGHTIAKEGVGSPGRETTYFGLLTQAALARFQKASNITPAIGFLGPITRAHISSHPLPQR